MNTSLLKKFPLGTYFRLADIALKTTAVLIAYYSNVNNSVKSTAQCMILSGLHGRPESARLMTEETTHTIS